MKRKILMLTCAISWVITSTLANADHNVIGSVEAGKTKSAACSGCHMPDGNTANPEWPKIAGQIPSYMVKQLMAFKEGDRENKIMDPFVKPLSHQDIEDIAQYFGTQNMKPGVGDPAQLALGEKIYKKGKFYTPLTACIGCHGMRGEGNHSWEELMAAPPSVLAPAIGGQNATYLIKQLLAFKTRERTNDVGEVMQRITLQMTNEQIEAVAQYITQLQ